MQSNAVNERQDYLNKERLLLTQLDSQTTRCCSGENPQTDRTRAHIFLPSQHLCFHFHIYLSGFSSLSPLCCPRIRNLFHHGSSHICHHLTSVTICFKKRKILHKLIPLHYNSIGSIKHVSR